MISKMIVSTSGLGGKYKVRNVRNNRRQLAVAPYPSGIGN